MVIRETLNRTDPFEARVATALALEKMGPLLPQALVAPVVDFLVAREALGDRNASVRKAMLNAGIAIVDLHGGEAVTSLMKTFEEYLGRSGPSSETADFIKEAVVIVSNFTRIAYIADLISFSAGWLVTSTPKTLGSRRSLIASSMRSTRRPSLSSLQ